MEPVLKILVWLCAFCCYTDITMTTAHVVSRRNTSGGSKRVVCYYTNWSVYRNDSAQFNAQRDIYPYLCTHLIYAFIGLTPEYEFRIDEYEDIDRGGYAKFTGIKTYNKQLKTLLGIGGTYEGSSKFSPLVASADRREKFIKNVVLYLRKHNFDGLDLGWNFPTYGQGSMPQDRQNYALLVQELREEFDRESVMTGKPRLLVTMAGASKKEQIDKAYDVPKLNKYVDFMNLLTYDYHSSDERSVNHHSPLYPLKEKGEDDPNAFLNIDYTINYYLEMGMDPDKLVLGIPTYGRSFTLLDPLKTGIDSPADGEGYQGKYTLAKGYLAYFEICEELKNSEFWKVEKPYPNLMGPYAYKGNQWVGYDDENMVREKARYVLKNNLGGIMFWNLDNDDFRGNCQDQQYPLIRAGREIMLEAAGNIIDPEKTTNQPDIPEKVDNSSQDIPEKVDNSSQDIPEKVDNSSQDIPEKVNNSSQDIPEKVGNSSQDIPEKVDNSSQDIPEKVDNSSDVAKDETMVQQQLLAAILPVIIPKIVEDITAAVNKSIQHNHDMQEERLKELAIDFEMKTQELKNEIIQKIRNREQNKGRTNSTIFGTDAFESEDTDDQEFIYNLSVRSSSKQIPVMNKFIIFNIRQVIINN